VFKKTTSYLIQSNLAIKTKDPSKE